MIIADVWKTAPFMALLILAGLQVIPGEIYEAAKVDGATAWQRFRKITLPLLKPAILVALIFRTLDALRIFDLPYVLTKGANGTNTLSLIAQQTFSDEPDLRPGLGARDPDVHHRDDRLVRRTSGSSAATSAAWRRTRPWQAATQPPQSGRHAAREDHEEAQGRQGRRRRGGCGSPSSRSCVFCLFPFYWLVNIVAEDGRRTCRSSIAVPAATRRSTTTSRSSRTPTSPRRCATARSSRSRRRRSR